MPELIVELPRPYEKQAEIIYDPARFKVLCCGRRFGKTETAKIMLISRMLEGQRVAYFAPSYKMTRQTYREMLFHLGQTIAKQSVTEMRIELITGGVLEMWSLSTMSAESVRGRKYHFIVIDEAAMVVNGMKVWMEVIRPMLMDYRGGALFCSTPRGRNYFFDLFNFHGLGRNGWKSWQLPSITNPFLLPQEIEEARQNTPERSFRQEYLAEFVEDYGDVFRNVKRLCTVSYPVKRNPSHTYVMGADFGKEIDKTVITIIDANTMQQVDLDSFNEVGWHVQRNRIRAMFERWRPVACYFEYNSIGDPNIEEFTSLYDDMNIIPFYTGNASKQLAIQSLQLTIEKEAIRLLEVENQEGAINPFAEMQLIELQTYTEARSKTGLIVYGAPQGGHDDAVMALALAHYGIHQFQPFAAQRPVAGLYNSVDERRRKPTEVNRSDYKPGAAFKRQSTSSTTRSKERPRS